MVSTDTLDLEKRTDKEIIESIESIIKDIRAPKKINSLKTYNLEVTYKERLLNGEVKEYTVQDQIKAYNLDDAKYNFFKQIMDSCAEAHRRKDIMSFGVNYDDIKKYKP